MPEIVSISRPFFRASTLSSTEQSCRNSARRFVQCLNTCRKPFLEFMPAQLTIRSSAAGKSCISCKISWSLTRVNLKSIIVMRTRFGHNCRTAFMYRDDGRCRWVAFNVTCVKLRPNRVKMRFNCVTYLTFKPFTIMYILENFLSILSSVNRFSAPTDAQAVATSTMSRYRYTCVKQSSFRMSNHDCTFFALPLRTA